MNATEKAIAVGVRLLLAVVLTAGATIGLTGQASAARQQGVGGGGMMSGGSGYGSGGTMGGFAGSGTHAPAGSGWMMMGGASGMMGSHGLLADGERSLMGCIRYMADYLGVGSNGTAS